MELWLCQNRPLPETVWRYGKLSYLLSAHERRAFLQNSHRPEKKQESALGKALQRLAIEHHTSLAAQDVIIKKSPKGKPFIDPDILAFHEKHTQFNLSHSKHFVCCAIGQGKHIGVDIEVAGRRNNLMAIAERYFHREENKQLQTLKNENAQHKLFLLLWTLKEATIKALGETIGSMSLDEVPFEIQQDRIVPLFSDKSNCRWLYNIFQPNEVLTLCTVQAAPRYQSADKQATLHSIDLKHFNFWRTQQSQLLYPAYSSH